MQIHVRSSDPRMGSPLHPYFIGAIWPLKARNSLTLIQRIVHLRLLSSPYLCGSTRSLLRRSKLSILRDAEVYPHTVGPTLTIAIAAQPSIQTLDKALVTHDNDVAIRVTELKQAPTHTFCARTTRVRLIVHARAAALAEIEVRVAGLEL